MAELRDGGMAEWRDGRMAEGQNGGMVFYYIPNLSCYIYCTCQRCRRRRRQHQQHQGLLNHLDVLTGALFRLTPFCSDFINYVECDIPVWDVTKVNKVIGIGTTIHKLTDINGNPVFLPCVSYHLPQTDVCCFSPQTYHQMHGGYSEIYG
jgi:hypothetical protein